MRRADEMGDAITARGGIGRFGDTVRPKPADWFAISITVAVCTAAIWLEVPRPAGYRRAAALAASSALRRVVATSLRPKNISSKYG